MMKFIFILVFFASTVLYAQENVVDFEKMQISGKYLIPQVPEWSHNAVFYEIYPQTFNDSNGDGIGDIPGIIEKLDYVKSLGVNAIWLNPIYVSPFRDAGYDVADYYTVAPRYGTNADARRLFQEVHKRGMRIILDYVPGHTSIDHPWFKTSCSPIPNKYSNWYIWTNGTWFNNMDNYSKGFIQGYSERDGNFMTNFFWHQPALNYGYGKPDPLQPWQLPVDHPDVLALKAEMKNVLKFWLDMGCDGFRVDMAGSLVKNDVNGDCSNYWQNIRKWFNTDFPDAFMVSEWSYPIAAINGGFHSDFMHWFNGYDDLFKDDKATSKHSFFNSDGKGNIYNFLQVYFNQLAPTKDRGYITVPFANHDIPRIKIGNRTDKDLEIIFAFELTIPGIPFLYYGDEIGMRQLYNLPFIEGSYGTRAGDRTPMQWTNGVNNGFSAASPDKLWQKTDADPNAPNVADMENDKASLLNAVRKLISLRRTEQALAAYAEFVPVVAKPNTYPFVFVRAAGKSRILVALNPSAKDVQVSFNLENMPNKYQLIAGNESGLKMNGSVAELNMKGVSYAIYKF